MTAKAFGLLSLARRGRILEAGEEPVGAICRARKAALVIVASDAADHSIRRVKSFVSGTKQVWMQIPCTKEELGGIIGRGVCAMAAFSDPRMALAFAQALESCPEEILAVLTAKAERAKKRSSEEKAHIKNVRSGKKKTKK